MDPRALVRPLEPAWQAVLDSVLGAQKTTDIAALAPKVAELSRAYNAGTAAGAASRLPLDARIAFSFPRDVPKGAAAVRELIASKALALGEEPLRILDLGAGLGAMTWGVARALAAAGQKGRIEATLVDEDAQALAVAEKIGRHATVDGIELVLRTRKERLATTASFPRADLVLVGQVLSELDLGRTPAERLDRHADLLRHLLTNAVTEHGSLVVIEPALRDRTRHLQTLRDRLAANATIFAPCLHASACPMLADEDAWCHEDLPIDLPSFIVPLARAAGLRFQGLTFAYLVLRKDDLSLRKSVIHDDRVHLRIVSELLRSKGKTELFGCMATGERWRIRRLDRDEERGQGTPFDDLAKGDLVRFSGGTEPPIDDRGRLIPVITIDVWRGAS